MKFELESLEEFIKSECKKSKKPFTKIDDFSGKRLFIEQEVERIKKGFSEHLLKVENESRIELFIQHHQSQIIRLADKVVTVIDKEESLNIREISIGNTGLDLCKVLLRGFEELLYYIETYFSKYFDQDQKIPDAYALISAKEFREKIVVLRRLVKERGVDNELSEIALYPIVQFIAKQEKQSITFRRLIYMKYLMQEMIKILEAVSNSNYSESIRQCLIYLNHNHFHFIQHLTKRIQSAVEDLPSSCAQIEYMLHEMKKLKQTQVKPSFSYKSTRDPVVNIISNWLLEEVYYTEKKHQLTLMMPPAGKEINQPSAKIKTIFSVSQLAYFTRLLKETGVIKNESKSELFRLFSSHFSSIQSDNISVESFRSKFFAFEKSTVTHVQHVLNKLVEQSEKDL